MRTPQAAATRFHLAFASLGLAFLAIFSWVFLQEYLADWRTTQGEFAGIQQRVKDPHALSLAAPLGEIRQIWLPDIDRVDRCTTCHLGIDDPDFAGERQPFATHSGTWLDTHPPNQFGCTTCHGGQGVATDFENAAHEPIPHFDDPMRSTPLLEANCGACHREREPQQAPWLAGGRDLIASSGCIACHDLPGFRLAEVRVPRLESVGYKVRPDWLERWLADPEAYLPEARMPNFRLELAEVEDLSAFLLAQRQIPPLDTSAIDWSLADANRGRIVFAEARCITCHKVDGRGGTLGPELTTVGSKVRRSWLASFLTNPMHDQPDTLMVRYRLSGDDVRDLTTYLTEELIDPSAPEIAPEVRYLDPEQVDRGRSAFIEHGCYSCHQFAGMAALGKIGPNLSAVGDRPVEVTEFRGREVLPTLPNFLYLKLREPAALADESRMPTYNFSEADAAAAVVALLSVHEKDLPASLVTSAPEPSPYEPQGQFGVLVNRYRCLSCHMVNGWGGELSTVPLDHIGSQLQREYVTSYLLRPSAVRVHLEERMPYFHMTPEEAETIAAYFATVFVDDELDEAVALDPDSVRRGQQLFESLGCRGCHLVGGRGGYVGPDLSGTGRRLTPGWIRAWLTDPAGWKPGSLQPDYGLDAEEARALTAYLMTLRSRSGGNP